MDMSLSKLQKMAKDREAWYAEQLKWTDRGRKESDTTEPLNNNTPHIVKFSINTLK